MRSSLDILLPGLCCLLLFCVPSANAAKKGNSVCLEWIDPSTAEESSILSNGNGLLRVNDLPICRSEVEPPLTNTSNDTTDTDTSNTPIYDVGVLRNGVCSSLSSARNQTKFEVAASNSELCKYFSIPIAHDVNPLSPTIIIVGKAYLDGASNSQDDMGICTYNNDDGSIEIGTMYLTGKWFGHCGIASTQGEVTKMIGGGYSSLSAWPVVVIDDEDDSTLDGTVSHEDIFADINKRVKLYITDSDKELISKITQKSFDELMTKLSDPNIISTRLLNDVLSTERFIAHELNLYGLSLLRSILAERMINARRRIYNLDSHPDTIEWERNGVLLKDYDYYSAPEHREEFHELLQMCGAIESIDQVPDFQWSDKTVVADNNDPQQEPHVDTFHSVVKMWAYERGVVTIDHGPLHFMLGSSTNSEEKLRWVYNVTIPPAIEAIQEPSFRYRGNPVEDKMSDQIRPVLPLQEYKRTLIIADTSGIHHRGFAVEGTVRRTLRVQAGFDGGLPRQSPFVWNGWENWGASV